MKITITEVNDGFRLCINDTRIWFKDTLEEVLETLANEAPQYLKEAKEPIPF